MGAFPGRFSALFPNNSQDWDHWSDYGNIPDVTTDLCSGDTIPAMPYPPTGPRGWQDEYCEWSVTRNANGKITSVMFTCENPEYWLTLWNCDPNAVLAQYRALVSAKVQLLDLALRGEMASRSRIRPLVAGRTTRSTSGTAVRIHIPIAAALCTHQFAQHAWRRIRSGRRRDNARIDGNGSPVTAAAALVCCARYGKIGRHSDPTIGQNVNALVNHANIPVPWPR
jgi:hypothetical protein